MSLAATVQTMAESGCSAEQIARVVAAAEAARALELEAKRERRRAGNAERQRQKRIRDKEVTPCHGVTERDGALHDVTERDNLPSDKEKSPTPSKENNSYPPTISPLRSEIVGAPDKPAPKKPKPNDVEVLEILESCLTPQTAADLVAHRKAKKSPITAGAARALTKSFIAFGDPEAAASAMMANGWQGFNPEWMRNQARAGPAIPPQNNRNVYLGVDQQKQLLDEYYDRREGKIREPALKLIG